MKQKLLKIWIALGITVILSLGLPAYIYMRSEYTNEEFKYSPLNITVHRFKNFENLNVDFVIQMQKQSRLHFLIKDLRLDIVDNSTLIGTFKCLESLKLDKKVNTLSGRFNGNLSNAALKDLHVLVNARVDILVLGFTYSIMYKKKLVIETKDFIKVDWVGFNGLNSTTFLLDNSTIRSSIVHVKASAKITKPSYLHFSYEDFNFMYNDNTFTLSGSDEVVNINGGIDLSSFHLKKQDLNLGWIGKAFDISLKFRPSDLRLKITNVSFQKSLYLIGEFEGLNIQTSHPLVFQIQRNGILATFHLNVTHSVLECKVTAFKSNTSVVTPSWNSLDVYWNAMNFTLNKAGYVAISPGSLNDIFVDVNTLNFDYLNETIEIAPFIAFFSSPKSSLNSLNSSVYNLDLKGFVVGIIECSLFDVDSLVDYFWRNIKLIEHLTSDNENLKREIQNLDIPRVILEKIVEFSSYAPMINVAIAHSFPLNETLKMVAKNLIDQINSVIEIDAIIEEMSLEDIPEAITSVLIPYISEYPKRINRVIRENILQSVLQLGQNCTRDDIIVAAVHASGPFLQKMFQLLAEYYEKHDALYDLLQNMKNKVKPMTLAEFYNQTQSIRDLYHIEPDPIASASIAQGHLAFKKNSDGTLQRETRLFAKIQRPFIRERLGMDHSYMNETIKRLNSSSQGVFSTLFNSFFEEIDFEREFNNGRYASSIYKGRVRSVKYKHVYEKRIIIMEYVSGENVNNVQMTNEKAVVLAELVQEMMQNWFENALFPKQKIGFFHGDLHSGNRV
jgi:hypothetical protein